MPSVYNDSVSIVDLCVPRDTALCDSLLVGVSNTLDDVTVRRGFRSEVRL